MCGSNLGKLSWVEEAAHRSRLAISHVGPWCVVVVVCLVGMTHAQHSGARARAGAHTHTLAHITGDALLLLAVHYRAGDARATCRLETSLRRTGVAHESRSAEDEALAWASVHGGGGAARGREGRHAEGTREAEEAARASGTGRRGA